MLDPQLPGLFRNILIYPLTEFAPPRYSVQPRQVLSELNAVHRSRARRHGSAGGRLGSARIVGHFFLLAKLPDSSPYRSFAESPNPAIALAKNARGTCRFAAQGLGRPAADCCRILAILAASKVRRWEPWRASPRF